MKMRLDTCGRVLLMFMAALVTAAGSPALGATTFVYQATSNAPSFHVTTNGLSSIRLGTQEVAVGSWFAADAGWELSTNRPGGRWEWSFPEKRVERIADDHVRVLHVGPEAAVTCDYRFRGEDVEIQSRVENRTEERTIDGVVLGGLVFKFSRSPDGLAMSAAPWVLQRMGSEKFHPSFHNNFGGSYLCDDTFGVGATPLRNGWLPTVLWWPVEVRTTPPDRPFRYIRAATIPPGCVMRFDVALRVSRNHDWRHLLEPYRDHFKATYGPVRYRADYRPFGYCQGSNEKAAKDPNNPYGWQWLPWRFDRIEGVTNFAQSVVATLKRANAQGALIWAHSGWNPRGCNFRPDFDVLPPEMEALMPELTAPFHRAGLRLGFLARPQIVTSDTWKYDTVLNLSADEPTQMAMAARRFGRMISQGVTVYYIDTFGSAPQDARAMKQLREDWGNSIAPPSKPAGRPAAAKRLPEPGQEMNNDPEVETLLETKSEPAAVLPPEALRTNVLTFTEFWSDVSLVHSGGYTQYLWDKKLNRYREFWWRDHLWEVCEWLVPGAQIASPGGLVETYEKPTPPPDSPTLDLASPAASDIDIEPSAAADRVKPPDTFRYLMEHHVTPLFYLGTRTTSDMADALKILSAEFLDEQGQWKK